MIRIFGALALSFATAAGLCGAVYAEVPAPVAGFASGTITLAPVLKKITPAVVSIEIKGRITRETGRKRATQELRGAGSGVVYDAQHGYIVTNNHVIDHADEITVTLTDGRIFKAKRVGADPDFDVAVIKVPADNLTAIPFADSRELQVGDFVLAIGYPMQIGQSVTSGIVSGLHRTNIGVEQYENFIQTDAAVYPGNSGGALVNLQGDLVGINTAFIGATTSNPGMGFAIPVNMARTIADQILEFGDVHRGSIGITTDDPAPAANGEAPPAPSGAVITKVEAGSAAEHAGLKAGDVVTEIGDRQVINSAFLRNRLALLRVGEAADITVLRDGKSMMLRPMVTAPSPEPRGRSK
jgi:S1-C subfamily serine protease